jgi:hypothetical protein
VFLSAVPVSARRLPLLALVAVASLIALASAPAANARPPRDFVGLTSDDVFNASTSYQNSNLSAQTAAGAGLLRQVFDWSVIETSPGSYNFSKYDSYVAATAGHGLKILPVLFNPPSFRAKGHGGHGTWPPASNSAYGAFVRQVALRYGRHGSFWSSHPGIPYKPFTAYQIWNEPSLGVYWLPHPSPRGYAKLLKAARRSIKSVDRRAEIVTAGIPNSLLGNSIRVFKFVKRLYKAHGKRYFDTLAFNAYARNSRELKRNLRRLRRLMNHFHDRRAKIWITEIGWASAGPRHRFNVGPTRQARNIRSSFRLIRKVRRRWRLRGVVYYSWRDLAPYAPLYKDLWGLHTGLLNRNGTPKPAFFAFKSAVSRLRR